MAILIRRRTFLKVVGAGGLAVSLPWLPGCSDSSSVAQRGNAAHFFSPDERGALTALAGALVPEDETVGAVGAGAIEYVDRMLAAFDNPLPDIYRAGPFSGRWPFQDSQTGDPSDHFPPDSFREVLPLTRMQELSFRIELFGSGSVPNGDINAPLVPSTPGLQALYREGLAQLQQAASQQGVDFSALDDAAKLAAFSKTSPDFQNAVLTHLAEGMFSAPEYGGNTDTIGWRDYHYDGDSQPLGHTLYDERSDTLRDRADQPNQTLDPNLPNDGFEPSVTAFIDSITRAQGGKRFF